MTHRAIFILSAALFPALLAQQSARPVRSAAEIQPLLDKVATYEYGGSREPWAQLTLFIEEAQKSPAIVKEIEMRLLKFLDSSATAAGKTIAMRELSFIATEASVPAMAALLAKQDTAEMARYVLERIPGPAAGDALRNALESTSGRTRIGIINSLAQRRDVKSVPALQRLLTSTDQPTLEAAVAALARIGDRAAIEALAATRRNATPPLRQRLTEAYLQGAEQSSAGGDNSTALRIYKELLTPEEPEMVRIAALRNLAALDPGSALPVLRSELQSNSPLVQAAALRTLRALSGPPVAPVLVQSYPKVPPRMKVKILGALAHRRESSAKSLFLTAIKDDDAEIRIAAISGLADVADASAVEPLALIAANSTGAEQTAARESLAALRGAAVDSAIVSAIDSATGKVKAELILAAGERVIASSAPVLAKVIEQNVPEMRQPALRALRNVAGPQQIPMLADLVVKASTPAERTEATQALAIVLKRSEPAHAAPVVAAYRKASAVEARAALIEALGQSANDDALAVLRSGLKDSSPEIARASVLALTEWSTAAPLEDLLAIARSDSGPTLQVLALRGALKLLALPSDRSRKETVALLGEALRLAKQTAEKRTVLAMVANYPSKEALKLAESAVRDEAVAREAKVAVQRISARLKE